MHTYKLKIHRKEKEVTVILGVSGKLRIYFYGSSLVKVFPLSSECMINCIPCKVFLVL